MEYIVDSIRTGGWRRVQLAIVLTALAGTAGAAEPQQVAFPSGNLELRGFIFKPEGSGPFPAVLYNHGSEKLPGSKLDFLKKLPYVDPGRIAVAGCSFGGIQTMLAAEKDLGLRAAVAFAPAAMTWRESTDIQARLIDAARRATVPVFLIQAENDYDLSPTRVLSQQMEQAGKPHQAKVYPPYGTTQAEGHGGFCFRGVDVWGGDVLSFLSAHSRR